MREHCCTGECNSVWGWLVAAGERGRCTRGHMDWQLMALAINCIGWCRLIALVGACWCEQASKNKVLQPRFTLLCTARWEGFTTDCHMVRLHIYAPTGALPFNAPKEMLYLLLAPTAHPRPRPTCTLSCCKLGADSANWQRFTSCISSKSSRLRVQQTVS